jgi:hypothetical protein
VQRVLAGRADVTALAVTPAVPAELRRLRAERGLGMRLLADPTGSLYHAWKLPRGSWAGIWLSPATWLAYLRLLARGRRPGRPTEDVYQLGGDAVIDRRGIVTWVYRSRHPADRPAAAEIIRRIGTAAAEADPGRGGNSPATVP